MRLEISIKIIILNKNEKIMNKKILLSIPLMCLAGLVSCNDSNKKEDGNGTVVENHDKPKRKYDKAQDFTYTNWNLKDNDSVKKTFKQKFTAQELATIVALNRVDKNTFHTVDVLTIPDKFDDDFMAYSPFPFTVKSADKINKLVVFSYPIQAYGVYENGELVKWGPTSMGSKQHKTPEGLYFTNWKGEEVQSTFDDEWILRWNFNVQNEEGIGWHQYSLPGYPASHSCLRLLESDAKWLYDWADEWILADKENVEAKGTPVIVYGAYNFDGEKPWLQLAANNKANDIATETLDGLIKKYEQEILKEQENRAKVVANKPQKQKETKS